MRKDMTVLPEIPKQEIDRAKKEVAASRARLRAAPGPEGLSPGVLRVLTLGSRATACWTAGSAWAGR